MTVLYRATCAYVCGMSNNILLTACLNILSTPNTLASEVVLGKFTLGEWDPFQAVPQYEEAWIQSSHPLMEDPKHLTHLER